MNSMKTSWFLLCSILLFSIFPVVASASENRVADPGMMGPYDVGFTQYTLIDTSRNTDTGGRPVPVFVWYPVNPEDVDQTSPGAAYPLDPINFFLPVIPSFLWENYGFDQAYQEPPVSPEGPFPTVVFSPGWGASAMAHLYVGTRLASHGFVVAVVYHWGDQAWPWEPLDHLAVAALNRPKDISFVMDSLLGRNITPGDLLENTINPEQIAASGWSLGGYASMALASGDDLVCDTVFELGFLDTPLETCVPTLPDQRIKAIVPLDGSNQLLWFEELARIDVPTMGIGEEWSTLEAGPGSASWQARLHAAGQGHPSYRVDVRGASHATFSNLCEGYQLLFDIGILDQGSFDYLTQLNCIEDISRPEAYRLTTKYMIAFLKTNLANVPGYQHILTPGYAIKEPDIEFFVTEKRNPNAIDQDWPEDYMYFMHQPGSQTANAKKNPMQLLSVPNMGLN